MSYTNIWGSQIVFHRFFLVFCWPYQFVAMNFPKLNVIWYMYFIKIKISDEVIKSNLLHKTAPKGPPCGLKSQVVS